MVPPVNRYIARLTNSSVDRVGSGEIEPRLNWVRESNNSTRLIVGDSVGNQIFIGLRGINEEYCIATSNQAVTMAGHYILISEYVKTHENVDDVYLIIIPQTLCSDINTRLTYQYFVMPFLGNDCQDYLSRDIGKKLEDKFGSFFLRKEIIRAIDLSCVNRKLYLNFISGKAETGEEKIISYTTYEYLVWIRELCMEEGINFYLLPAPVADTRENHSAIAMIEEEFEKLGLNKQFPGYFEQIQYYPAEQFRDGIHFGDQYTDRTYLNRMIEDIVNKSEDITGLRAVYGE